MNQIVKAPMNEPTTFESMEHWAGRLLKSGYLPTAIKTVEQALMIMLCGKELGLGFTEALRSINIIQQKPCMSSQLLLGLCRRTGEVEQAYFEKETAEECVFVLTRKGNPPYKASFSMEDAKRMGIAGKDNYQKQPKTMLSWRAIAKACRFIFPDAVSGVYTEEEIADDVVISVDPKTQEATVQEITQTPPAEPVSVVKEPPVVLEGESLMGWTMPSGKYAGMTLGMIFDEKTEAGAKKGLEYLKWCISPECKGREETKEIIRQFLAEVGE